MFSRRMMKAGSHKARRSHFYHLMIWHLPVRRTAQTERRLDALGVVIVIGLLAGMLLLMRFVLSH
ncbi:MAG TPA: hypothetical protein VG347_14985 [Verrucomicrobiae bacterium]|nr:hypothetical protein [Verrucomicrobiae bacterium]